MATSSMLSRLAVVLLIASSTCAVSTTGAQESGRRDEIQWQSVDRGFLFVDGQYVPRPYEFRREGDAYFVNEINIATLGIDLSTYEEEAKARLERRDRKRSRGQARDPLAKFHSDLNTFLYLFDTVLLVPGLSPVFLHDSNAGADLLRALIDEEKRAATSTSVPDWKPYFKPADQQRVAEHLSEWLASFRPSPAFLADATARLEVLDSAEAATDKSSAATLRLATFGYPLTILMMILVVLGFGHLLSHRPNTDEWNDDSPSNQLSKPFNRTLLLIAGLSAVDLVWTLLVSQAGAMRELNPIGSQMIDDPLQLVAFKVLVTLAAVGLLYFCRRIPLARQASWWSCLVLTLVAARWLVFNSMFIS